jgi:hypothetical protein
MSDYFEGDLDDLSKLPFKKIKKREGNVKAVSPLYYKLDHIEKRLKEIEEQMSTLSKLFKNELLKAAFTRKHNYGNNNQ